MATGFLIVAIAAAFLAGLVVGKLDNDKPVPFSKREVTIPAGGKREITIPAGGKAEIFASPFQEAKIIVDWRVWFEVSVPSGHSPFIASVSDHNVAELRKKLERLEEQVPFFESRINEIQLKATRSEIDGLDAAILVYGSEAAARSDYLALLSTDPSDRRDGDNQKLRILERIAMKRGWGSSAWGRSNEPIA